MKSFPWISAALLLASYATFSWFLYSLQVSWMAWAAVVGFSLVEALLLTTFSRGLRQLLKRWLTSDLGYFTTVICAAFLVAIALVWIKVFSYVLSVIAAELLARLDLQSLGYKRWQAFLVLTTISLVGLGLGVTANHFTPT